MNYLFNENKTNDIIFNNNYENNKYEKVAGGPKGAACPLKVAGGPKGKAPSEGLGAACPLFENNKYYKINKLDYFPECITSKVIDSYYKKKPKVTKISPILNNDNNLTPVSLHTPNNSNWNNNIPLTPTDPGDIFPPPAQPQTTENKHSELPGVDFEYDGRPKCILCDEDIATGQKARVLVCRHLFHTDCLQHWTHNYNSFCPICRQS